MASRDEGLEISSTGKCTSANVATAQLGSQHSTPLTLTQSVKKLSINGARSLGTFVGITGEKDKSTLHWKVTWIKRVKSGNVGISLQVGIPQPKSSTAIGQLEETLSQLTQIGNTIDPELTLSDRRQLNLLEDIRFKQRTISLSCIPPDLRLSPSLKNLLDSCTCKLVNTDKHEIEDKTEESSSYAIAEHCKDFKDCASSVSFSVDAHVHSTQNGSSESLLFPTKNQFLFVMDNREADSNGACTETDKQTFTSATFIESEYGNGHNSYAELNSGKGGEVTLSQVDLLEQDKRSIGSTAAPEENYVYGKEAFGHYRLFQELENHKQLELLEDEKQKCIKTLQWQLETLEEIATVGKDYFNNPEGKAGERWKELQSDVAQKWSDKMALENQLGSLPTFFPFFTYFIILAQALSLIVLCSLGGVTIVSFDPVMELRENMKTFLGTEIADKLTNPNPWIGPSSLYFIGVGAVYAPCMREDYQLNLYNVQRNYSTDNPLGCCEVVNRNTAGTTTAQECDTLTNGVGQWRSGTVCSERVSGENYVQHNMWPCCFGNMGACHLRSHSHCVFLGGQAHTSDSQHCSQVNCLADICGIGEVLSAASRPWLAVSPGQWWRLPLSLLYCQGLLQLMVITSGHLLLTRRIEVIAGWLRVAFIFTISGTLGLTAAAIFSPYEAHVGSVGGLFCMVGVALVEFLQSWTLVDQQYRELAKFITIIVLFLVFGTLPHLSNAQLVTSFITGMITAVLILPYVTFGRWHRRCRRILVGLAAPLLFVIIFLLLFIFYNVQSVLPQCSWCHYMECIPYTNKLCSKPHFTSVT